MADRGVARVTQDTAGGMQLGMQAPTVFVNGTNIVVLGDRVAGHGKGPHGGPVMMTASDFVFAHGIPICRLNDLATCGHPTTGSSNVFSE